MTPEARADWSSAAAGASPERTLTLGSALFVAYWLIGLGFLVCPPCAQWCAGLSRFVGLTGAAALYLAWPKALGLRAALARLVGMAPLLILALALDLQAGLPEARALHLAAQGGLLCLACLPLGAVRTLVHGRIWVTLFGVWFLLPLVLGLWSHAAGGIPWAPGSALAWSPIGAYWRQLPLFRETISGWEMGRLGVLIAAGIASLWLGKAWKGEA